MLDLRDYQRRAYDATLALFDRGVRRVLAVMATGTGKTVYAGHVAKAMIARTGGKRVMVLVHRDELIRQAVDKWTRILGYAPEVEKAGEAVNEGSMYGGPPVVVASVQTLNSGGGAAADRRMGKFRPEAFGLVWQDEAHHATAASFARAIDYLTSGGACLLGVTATADRADGTALGEVFEEVAFTYDLPDAIADGYLVPVRQRPVVIEGLNLSNCRTTAGDLNAGDLEAELLLEKPLLGVAHATVEIACGLSQYALNPLLDDPDRTAKLAAMVGANRRRKTLVFCAGVKLAERLAEIFCRWLPESALHVDGSMPPDRRRDVFAAFRDGRIQFLTACMVPTEGYDEPSVEMVVMARPTKSRPLYAQMAGRGTRPLDGVAGTLASLPDAAARRAAIAASEKSECAILDFVGNTGRHRLVTAADLLGGERYDPAVVQRAAEIAQETEGGADVEQALLWAEQEAEEAAAVEQLRAEAFQAVLDAEEERQRSARAAAGRAGLVATAEYSVGEVDAFDRTRGAGPGREHAAGGRGGASDGQINFLVKLGVQRAAAGYSKRQASAVIESLKKKPGSATKGQRWLLREHGYQGVELDQMSFDDAGRAIDAAKADKAAAAGGEERVA
jgi:superfamily II DNA or RNA helicase